MSVTARGGYQIVDLEGAVFDLSDSSGVKVPGTHEQAVNALNKPAMINHLNIKAGSRVSEVAPFYVATVAAPDEIQMTGILAATQIIQVSIDSDDMVYVSIVASN